jgi:hypothetical protein
MDLKTLIDAEMAEYSDGAYADHGSARDCLESFAARVATEEREACAKAVEAEMLVEPTDSDGDIGYDTAIVHAAIAIRRRSNVELTGSRAASSPVSPESEANEVERRVVRRG